MVQPRQAQIDFDNLMLVDMVVPHADQDQLSASHDESTWMVQPAHDHEYCWMLQAADHDDSMWMVQPTHDHECWML